MKLGGNYSPSFHIEKNNVQFKSAEESKNKDLNSTVIHNMEKSSNSVPSLFNVACAIWIFTNVCQIVSALDINSKFKKILKIIERK